MGPELRHIQQYPQPISSNIHCLVRASNECIPLARYFSVLRLSEPIKLPKGVGKGAQSWPWQASHVTKTQWWRVFEVNCRAQSSSIKKRKSTNVLTDFMSSQYIAIHQCNSISVYVLTSHSDICPFGKIRLRGRIEASVLQVALNMEGLSTFTASIPSLAAWKHPDPPSTGTLFGCWLKRAISEVASILASQDDLHTERDWWE